MLAITDVEVDNADDIILTDDLEIEWNAAVSTIRCAERRVSARYDDFMLDDISAGIERFILQSDRQITKDNVESAIRQCLEKDSLLFSSDYDVFILDATSDRKLPIIIRFRVPGVDDSILEKLTFRVLVNIENQRSYK